MVTKGVVSGLDLCGASVRAVPSYPYPPKWGLLFACPFPRRYLGWVSVGVSRPSGDLEVLRE